MIIAEDNEKQAVRHLTVQDIEIALAAYFNVKRIECYCMREDWSDQSASKYPVIVATVRHSVV